ncbi:UNVERIFIED_CONTAM: hypothetical protein Slati_0394300 [Sesamum latifolium]|uniref:Uncharacterized protein n=1 Tax=Sesamum latifolium TaxID=2727402 RepID=A0AAW2XV66_9LAMI
MASQGARADPVASREESGESGGLRGTCKCSGVEVDREGVGADAPRPPGGAPVVGLPRSMHRSFRWLSKPSSSPSTVTCTGTRTHSSASAGTSPSRSYN